MKRIKNIILAIISISAILSLYIVNANAEEPINIYFKPDTVSLGISSGESEIISVYANRDFEFDMMSAFEWTYDINKFNIKQFGASDFTVVVNVITGKIKIIVVEGSVSSTCNTPLAQFEISAKEGIGTGEYEIKNTFIQVVKDIEAIDSSCESIFVRVDNLVLPTPDPTNPPTAAPTAKPSTGNNPNPTTAPTASPVKTAAPSATTAPAQTMAPTAAPTTVPTAAPDSQVFGDIAANYWASEYIISLYEAGIVNGNVDGNFYPENNVTRAEFTKMAVLIFDLEINDTQSTFVDVSAAEWYAPYIVSAVDAGMVNGVSDYNFAPNETVTREQMATIIGRRLESGSEITASYADLDSISDYAKGYVYGLTELGLLSGDETGNFRPHANATRAEASALLSRTMNIISE